MLRLDERGPGGSHTLRGAIALHLRPLGTPLRHPMTRWLIDGMNVIGSRPTGWWRDRPAAMRELTAELASLAERGDEVTVVFDGREPQGAVEAPGVEVVFAPGGPDSADDRIVAILADSADPAAITVVTSDARLERRAAELGASVLGAGAFRSRL
jgi:predicted RNA-binding protein with PIN domain